MGDAGLAGGGCEAGIEAAIGLYEGGRGEAAAGVCRGMLLRAPGDAVALNMLAVLACDGGMPGDALALLSQAGDGAGAAAPLNTRARALGMLGRRAEAEAAYRAAWAVRPAGAVANNLGCLLRDGGRASEAKAWLGVAASLLPGSAEVWCNLAEVLAGLGEDAASDDAYGTAVGLDHAASGAHARFGVRLLVRGRFAEAAACFREALRLQPGLAASHNNLGLALRGQGRTDEAQACFAAAVRCDPGCADGHYNLGCLSLLAGRDEEARACHDRALAADPLHGPALWGRCMAELPVAYDTAEAVAMRRAGFTAQLADLERAAADPGVSRALASAAGGSQPFFLPYQGECDRALMLRYGGLMSTVLRQPLPPIAGRPKAGERIRLGIVSGFFCEHTIWRLMLKGWLSEIDRSRFEVTAYHTGERQDAQTEVARRCCPRFVTGPAERVRAALVADRPHVLLYPEIGMDRAAARLGAERLAPLQCVAWGHPDTTGLPTMDLFLSSALMEPAGAEAHYTERLVRLPNLGVCYAADERAAKPCTRQELGLRDSAVVFWCGQALYKYLPQHDAVLARIAAAVGDCQFLFIGFAEGRGVTDRVRTRLEAAFAQAGLDGARHIRMVEPMAQGRFLGSVQAADVVLDSIGWSGGKSTLDMLAVAPAIVTLDRGFMRGRHTAAILRMADAAGTIAATTDAYCQLAVELARDPARRAAARRAVAAGRGRVLADRTAVRALEAVIARQVAAADGFAGDPSCPEEP